MLGVFTDILKKFVSLKANISTQISWSDFSNTLLKSSPSKVFVKYDQVRFAAKFIL